MKQAAAHLGAWLLGVVMLWLAVLQRVRRSGDPLGELSKITPAVLGRAATGSAVAFVLGLAMV